MMPLMIAAPGDKIKVLCVKGRPEVKKHLEDLGFVPETPIEVIQSQNGNMIVKIRDSKLALTKEMTQKIMVQQ